jgi:ATP-dependent DNA helicase
MYVGYSQCVFLYKLSYFQIPVCLYHGNPTERAELRRTAMSLDLLEGGRQKPAKKAGRPPKAKSTRNVSLAKKQKTAPTRGRAPAAARKSGRLSGRARKSYAESEDEEEAKKTTEETDEDDAEEQLEQDGPHDDEAQAEVEDDSHARARRNRFPVVVTTYEMIIKDRQQLSHYKWG